MKLPLFLKVGSRRRGSCGAESVLAATEPAPEDIQKVENDATFTVEEINEEKNKAESICKKVIMTLSFHFF